MTQSQSFLLLIFVELEGAISVPIRCDIISAPLFIVCQLLTVCFLCRPSLLRYRSLLLMMYDGPAAVHRGASKLVTIVDLVSHHSGCKSDLGLKWTITVLLRIKTKGIVVVAGGIPLVAHQTLGDGVASLAQLEPTRPNRHR